jgi:hypothetical protein
MFLRNVGRFKTVCTALHSIRQKYYINMWFLNCGLRVSNNYLNYIGSEAVRVVNATRMIYWIRTGSNSERARRSAGTYHIHLQR